MIVRECRHFEKITHRFTATRRWLFAVTTVLPAVVVPAGGLLMVDVYLHHRVENLGAVNVWGYRGPTIAAKRSGETRIVVGAYRGRVSFKPGLARRATAAAIGQAAAVADAVGRSLGRLTPLPASDSGPLVDTVAWRQ